MSPKLKPLDVELYKQLLAKEERYQAFGVEVTRISLAGIALLGFFVQYVRGKCVFNSEGIMLVLLGFSALAFSVSVVFALAHRYFSTKGFSLRVRQIQYQLRAEGSPLSDKHEGELEKATLGAARNFNHSSTFFCLSSIFCGFGAVLVVAAILLATWLDDRIPKKVCIKTERTASMLGTSSVSIFSGTTISIAGSASAHDSLSSSTLITDVARA